MYGVGEDIVARYFFFFVKKRRNNKWKKVNPQGDCKLYLNALKGIEKILSI